MNKIQKLFLTIVSLLVTTIVLAENYNITIKTPSYGKLSLEESSDVTSGTHAPGTVTIYAKPEDGYYLEEIIIEYVMDLDHAEGRRRAYINLGERIVLNKTTVPTQFGNNKANRYGGAYTFTMPSSNVEITATFKSALNFEANDNITIAISGGSTYDGLIRELVVTNSSTDPVTLIEGKDFQIISQQLGGANVSSIKNVGTYSFTIQGLGAYYGSKSVTDLTIEKAALTITPKNKSRQYRDANPAYDNTSSQTSGDFIYTGLQNGELNDVLTTQPTVTISADINSGVGDYVVTAKDAAAANYTIEHLTGTMTITPRDVNNTSTQAQVALSDNTYMEFNTDHYYKYDSGNEVTYQPSVSVIDPSDNNNSLILNTDYDVAYAKEAYGDNEIKKPGIYKATVTFKGNYTGSAIIRYYQIREKVSLPNSWNTYYYSAESGMNMKVPDGMEAYTIGSINTTQVGTILQTYILKGVPMLLYRTGATTDFYPELVKDATENNPSSRRTEFIGTDVNLDMATKASNSITHDYWIVIGDQFIRTKSGTLSAHKCYLELPKTQFSTPSIALSRGVDYTGIHQVDGERQTTEEFYDLSGRRVLKPTKGVYVINGKKVIIK